MAYTLLVHEQRGPNTRHIEVQVDTPAGPVVEAYNWGMDVPLATVRRETKALLDAKYALVVVSLPGAGQTL